MTATLSLLVAVAVGAALGLVYFLSVWHTARGLLPRASHPVLFALATLVARFALVLTGFYVLSGYGWHPLLAALAAFVGVRLILVRRLGAPPGEIQAGREPLP